MPVGFRRHGGSSRSTAALCNPAQTRLHIAGIVKGAVMPPTTSPAAVAVSPPANLGGVRHGPGRVLLVLGGFGETLVVAYACPLAILAVGIPIALSVRLLVGAVRALWHL
jgi:hypothetical protein